MLHASTYILVIYNWITGYDYASMILNHSNAGLLSSI